MGAMLGRNATHGRSGYNLVFVLVFVFAAFVVFTHLFHAPTREIYRNAYYKVKPMVEFGGEIESSVVEAQTESVGVEDGVTAPVPGASFFYSIAMNMELDSLKMKSCLGMRCI